MILTMSHDLEEKEDSGCLSCSVTSELNCKFTKKYLLEHLIHPCFKILANCFKFSLPYYLSHCMYLTYSQVFMLND